MNRSKLVAFTLATWLGTAGAAAQSSNERTLAEAFFQDGRKLLEEGKVPEACAKFGESQRIAPALGTLLNLAVCHERQGKLATAWAEFTAAATQAARAQDAERQLFAEERVKELQPRVPRLTISAEAPPPGLQIRLDATTMGEGALGSSIPIDPGEHAIEVSAPGYEPWSSKFQVTEGKQEALRVPPLRPSEAAPSAPAPSPSSSPAPAASTTQIGTAPAHGGAQRTLGYAALGVGALGLGLGGYFGLQTFSKRDDADANCPDQRCDATGYAKIEEARDSATLSTIGFGVGLAGVAAGTWLLLSAESPRETAGWRVLPDAHASGGGVHVGRSF